MSGRGGLGGEKDGEGGCMLVCSLSLHVLPKARSLGLANVFCHMLLAMLTPLRREYHFA